MTPGESRTRSTDVTGRGAWLGACIVLAACAGILRGQDADPPKEGDPKPAAVLIRAGKVYVDSTEVIRDGAVLIRDGKIESVGRGIEAPEGARVVDLPEGSVTAGLIDACSQAGVAGRFAAAEHRSEVVPELRVLDSVDLRSRDFDALRDAGVTTVYVTADPASVIGGQGTIVRTGGPDAGRIVRAASGVKATIGREPIFRAANNRTPFGAASFLTRRPTTRMGLTWVFRKSFADAKVFSRGGEPPTRGEGSPSDESIPVLIKILDGEIPLRIQARAQLDILTAIRLCEEFKISFILEEGHDANRCVEELARAKAPVIYGPLFDYPSGFRAASGEANRNRYSTPRVLLDGGVTTALTASDQAGEAALPAQAGYAMRFGLSRSEALAAVTTTPARILGIDDEAGRLARGRAADLVAWSGEPFDPTSRATVVMIGGDIVKDLTGN